MGSSGECSYCSASPDEMSCGIAQLLERAREVIFGGPSALGYKNFIFEIAAPVIPRE